MATVTNRVAAQALRGQAVVVTLDGSETTNKLPSLSVGQTCTIGSSSKTGRISEIPFGGNVFLVTPLMPNNRFDSTTSGYLAVSETITIV